MYLGAKIGVLGANGAGKSTLMKILAGTDKAFEGNVSLVPGIRIGHLAQVRRWQRWQICLRHCVMCISVRMLTRHPKGNVSRGVAAIFYCLWIH